MQAVAQFATVYSHYGVCAKKCATQYELAVHNEFLIRRSPKILKTGWGIFYEHNLSHVYGHLAKLLRIAVTLPVTSASAERVHSELKLVKTALRSTSANEPYI